MSTTTGSSSARPLLRDGKDALIISSGFMTMRALEAVLANDRLDVGVLHVSTIKPLDEATIKREAGARRPHVIVAENHTIVGGLGEAVAGVLLRSGIAPAFRQIAPPDEFLDAGALADAARSCTASRPRRWSTASRDGYDRGRSGTEIWSKRQSLEEEVWCGPASARSSLRLLHLGAACHNRR